MRNKILKYIILLAVAIPFSGYAQIDVLADTLIIATPHGDEVFLDSGLRVGGVPAPDDTALPGRLLPDSLLFPATRLQDSLSGQPIDTAKILAARKPALDDVIVAKSADSLVYNFPSKKVFLYEKGDVTYQKKQLKADFMQVDMETKLVYAYGREDTVAKKPTRPEFIDGSESFTMDTLHYNLKTGKGNMKGIATKDGEGFLLGERVKKMPDNTLNVAHTIYTTCELDHPHFGIFMTKGKIIPNKKVITGPAYLVMEDVPIPFLGVPFAFFPTPTEKNSGFIIPTFGEEAAKGFYIRDGGYYFTFGDYADLSLTGGLYSYGSWEASAISRYVKRYRWNGGLNLRFSKDIVGEKGLPDYVNQNNFRVAWTHTQDPKANPSSTFSASVNFSTSGYSKYGSTSINEYLNTQTNSSVAYSKSWAGKPFSFSTNLQHSQNSRDTTVSLSLPNVVFTVSRIYPFKRREAVGKQRWYEKVAMNYTGTFQNSVTVKEYDLFTDKMYDEMRNGANHVIPVSTSMNVLKYINISPSANYQERWYFKKVEQSWDQTTKSVDYDTIPGFYRVWDYRFSMGASTKIYGQINLPKDSKGFIRGVRHVITPTVSFSYVPDFSKANYGYYETVQVDSTGKTNTYSPYQGGLYGVPGKGQTAALSFSLQQNLEMKVRSDKDTTGFRKVVLIENLSISSNYNFLADSMNLSPFAISFRTRLTKSLALNVSASLDPYQLNAQGTRINKFMLSKGSLGRITNVSTSFGYSFNSSKQPGGASNDINSQQIVPPEYMDPYGQVMWDQMDVITRREYMPKMYYDFSLPWNFGFNYSFGYSKPGLKSNVTQTLGFNGSLTVTEKWGLTFSGGYDIQSRKITPGNIAITRDLHCWQMFFSWVPVGFRKSWSFTISVKSSMLKDLKLDKNSSFYDNLID